MREITVNYIPLHEINRRTENRPGEIIADRYDNRSVNRSHTFRKIRKNKKRKSLPLKLASAFAMILMSVILGLLVPTKAQAEDSQIYYKYFTSYMVQKGDTLWSIARQNAHEESYKEYINEVKDINHMYTDTIKAGQYIVIPYYSTEYVY